MPPRSRCRRLGARRPPRGHPRGRLQRAAAPRTPGAGRHLGEPARLRARRGRPDPAAHRDGHRPGRRDHLVALDHLVESTMPSVATVTGTGLGLRRRQRHRAHHCHRRLRECHGERHGHSDGHPATEGRGRSADGRHRRRGRHAAHRAGERRQRPSHPGRHGHFSAEPQLGTLGTPTGQTGADGRAATSLTVLGSGAISVTASVARVARSPRPSPKPASRRSRSTSSSSPTPTTAQRQAFVARGAALAGTDRRRRPQRAAHRHGRPVRHELAGPQPDGGRRPDPGHARADRRRRKRARRRRVPASSATAPDIPVLGLMKFDTADLDVLESGGLLQAVILHEMGHVLGFGTIWSDLNLLADPSALGRHRPALHRCAGASRRSTTSAAQATSRARRSRSRTRAAKAPPTRTGANRCSATS